MLQITKQGNSIVVQGLNQYFYPYNGTLELPVNSVITVVDEGDIVLFRSAANYDVLFSAKIDEITIDGQSVTKDNVGEVFGALSNVSSGGGLTPEQEEKLNNSVQISDYNADKATQTTIDEAQTAEINKVKGDIEGKQDIIQDLNAIREGADLGKTAIQEETDPIWTAEKGNYYIKTESDGKYATQVVVNEEIAARISDIRDVKATLETKADKTEIPTVPANVSAFTNDAGYLTEHQSLDNYYTKTEVNTSLESKADKTEIPSLNGYATEQWVGEQGYITEHQPLKTINGEAIVGNGNIEISSGKQISDILILPQDVEFTYKDGNKYKVVIKDISYNSEGGLDFTISVTENGLAPTYRKIGLFEKGGGGRWSTEKYDSSANGYKINGGTIIPYYVYIFSDDNNAIDENRMYFDLDIPLKSGTDIKTINGESILGSGDLVISGGGEETDPVWTAEKVNYYTKTEVNTSLESKANKTEIPTVPTNVSAFTNDAGYLTEHQSLDNYYTKSEVNTSLESKADKTEIPIVPTKVSEFTNDAGYLTEHQPLKTINGETIVGSGDIVISGGGEETDPVWTAEKVNYYTKSEVDTSLESKANKSEIPTVPTNVSAFTNDAGYLTEHQSLNDYYTKTEVNTSLETKANKSEIPTVPTNVSAFTNDAGYLTEHQSLSNYYTKSEIDGIVGNVNNALSEIING